jgi:hypothetical protein
MERITVTRSRACDQARSLVSLSLDDELSELEQALLDAHLGACAACAAFSVDVLAATAQLRAAPLVRLEEPIALPAAPRRGYLRNLQTGAAGAVAAAAVVAGVIGITPAVVDSSSDRQASKARFQEPVSPRWELQLRRQAQPSEGPGGIDTPV